jgi:hypothetical protein
MRKHWDIIRTHRESWTADDWAMHKFIKNLQVRAFVEGEKFYLVVYNRQHPSKSKIVSEAK